MSCSQSKFLRFVAVVFIACFFVVTLQGCALYRAMSGEEEESSDASITDDVDGSNYETGVRIQSVSVGHHHVCALTDNSEVYCWGSNLYGQLGTLDGIGLEVYKGPVKVEGVGQVKFLSAGGNHTCAISRGASPGKDEDVVICWGANEKGQVTGTQNEVLGGNVFSLKPVLGHESEFKGVYTGGDYTCVHLANDNVMCWGGLESKQFGEGNVSPEGFGYVSLQINSYANVSGEYLLSVSGMVASKYSHSCAIGTVLFSENQQGDSLHSVFCWGENTDGQLDKVFSDDIDNDFSLSRGIPTENEFLDVVSVGAGHTCHAMRTTGHIQCWGKQFFPNDDEDFCTYVEVEYDYSGDVKGSSRVVCQVNKDRFEIKGNIAGLVSGRDVTCVLDQDGKVECFGGSQYSKINVRVLSRLNDVPIEQFDIGEGFGCALMEGGEVWCWGAENMVSSPKEDTDWQVWTNAEPVQIKFN